MSRRMNGPRRSTEGELARRAGRPGNGRAMADLESTALDEKEIEARLGEVEPAIAREVILDLLADENLARHGALPAPPRARRHRGDGRGPRLRIPPLGAPARPPFARDGRPLPRSPGGVRAGGGHAARAPRSDEDVRPPRGGRRHLPALLRPLGHPQRGGERRRLLAGGLRDPLAPAAEEVVERFQEWKLLGLKRTTLEIGCGIGRMQAALSPHVAEAHGIDISPKMIDAARRRCAGLPNVFFTVTSGRDLADFPAERFDLVYAVDSFPYVHQAGPSDRRDPLPRGGEGPAPRGERVILHFSYRDSAKPTAPRSADSAGPPAPWW